MSVSVLSADSPNYLQLHSFYMDFLHSAFTDSRYLSRNQNNSEVFSPLILFSSLMQVLIGQYRKNFFFFTFKITPPKRYLAENEAGFQPCRNLCNSK